MNRPILSFWILPIILSVLALTTCFTARSTDTADDAAAQFVPQQVVAQNGTVIRIRPASQQLKVGDIATFEIQIDDVTNLTAAEVQVQFNPSILQAQDADSSREGIQLQPGTFPIPDFVVTNAITNTTGIIQYTLVQLPPTEPVSGNGLLASFTVQAVAPGNSELTFSATNLADADGQLIPVTAQASQITVSQITGVPTITITPATGTPTVQPMPTFTPISGALTPTTLPLTTSTPASPPVAASSPIPPVLPPDSATTPIPLVSDIPPGVTRGHCYRVQKGDTLYSLGQQFGMDPYFINLVNDLHPPGHIVYYQVLFIPEEYGRGPNIYIKKSGDTLASIAESCGLPVSHLAWVNHIDENAVLQDGHVLIMPIPPFPPPSRFPYPSIVFPPPYK